MSSCCYLSQVEVDKGFTNITSWPCPVNVSGSDAIQFKPGLTMSDKLRVWVPDIFRGTGLTAREEMDLYGVHLLRFAMVGGLGPIRRLENIAGVGDSRSVLAHSVTSVLYLLVGRRAICGLQLQGGYSFGGGGILWREEGCTVGDDDSRLGRLVWQQSTSQSSKILGPSTCPEVACMFPIIGIRLVRSLAKHCYADILPFCCSAPLTQQLSLIDACTRRARCLH